MLNSNAISAFSPPHSRALRCSKSLENPLQYHALIRLSLRREPSLFISIKRSFPKTYNYNDPYHSPTVQPSKINYTIGAFKQGQFNLTPSFSSFFLFFGNNTRKWVEFRCKILVLAIQTGQSSSRQLHTSNFNQHNLAFFPSLKQDSTSLVIGW